MERRFRFVWTESNKIMREKLWRVATQKKREEGSMDIFSRFKDSVASVTSEASQKVSYTTEKTKLNTQIRTNNKEIEKLTYQIGVKCVELHLQDEGSEYEELFSQIRRYQTENATCEMEIKRLGEEYDEQTRIRQQELKEKQEQREKERIERERENKMQAAISVPDENTVICSFCGTVNNEDAKFCIGCGKKIEYIQNIPAEMEVKEDTEVKKDTESDTETAVQKACKICGNVLGDGEIFCTQCGTKNED